MRLNLDILKRGRNAALAATLLASTALGGCAGITAAELSNIEKQVQAYTATACNFIPTVGTIASLLVGQPLIAEASQIGQTICTAIANAPVLSARHRAAGPAVVDSKVASVNGIDIIGHFTR